MVRPGTNFQPLVHIMLSCPYLPYLYPSPDHCGPMNLFSLPLSVTYLNEVHVLKVMQFGFDLECILWEELWFNYAVAKEQTLCLM